MSLVPFNATQVALPAAFAARRQALMANTGGMMNNDLTANIQASFGVVSIRGRMWRLKYRGVETILRGPDNNPVPHIDVVLVKASPQISKIYYEGVYQEGSDDAPTCFSVDGRAPDPGAEKPQAQTCAACPHNVWGSKITQQGTKTKACADSRRIALVPAVADPRGAAPDTLTATLQNSAFGGAVMMRIPPASLAEAAAYATELERMGFHYYEVVTRLGFDFDASYPRLTFRALRPLLEPEAPIILSLQEDPVVSRMLAEMDEAEVAPKAAPTPTQAPPPPSATVVPMQPAAPPPAANPFAQAAPAPAPVQAPPPAANPFAQAAPAPAPVQAPPPAANPFAAPAQTQAAPPPAANPFAAPAQTQAAPPPISRGRGRPRKDSAAPAPAAAAPPPAAADPSAQPSLPLTMPGTNGAGEPTAVVEAPAELEGLLDDILK